MWTLPAKWKIAASSYKCEPFKSIVSAEIHFIDEITMANLTPRDWALFNDIINSKDTTTMKPKYVQPLTNLITGQDYWALGADNTPFKTNNPRYFHVGNAYENEATAIKASKYFAALHARKTIPEYFKKLGDKVEWFNGGSWVPINASYFRDWSKATQDQLRAAPPKWLADLGPDLEYNYGGTWLSADISKKNLLISGVIFRLDLRTESPKNWRAKLPTWFEAFGPEVEVIINGHWEPISIDNDGVHLRDGHLYCSRAAVAKISHYCFRAKPVSTPHWYKALGSKVEILDGQIWKPIAHMPSDWAWATAYKHLYRAALPEWLTAFGPEIEFKSRTGVWRPAGITDTHLEINIHNKWIKIAERNDIRMYYSDRFRTALPKWNKPWPRTAAKDDPRGDRFVVSSDMRSAIVHVPNSVVYGPSVHFTQEGAKLQRKALKDIME